MVRPRSAGASPRRLRDRGALLRRQEGASRERLGDDRIGQGAQKPRQDQLLLRPQNLRRETRNPATSCRAATGRSSYRRAATIWTSQPSPHSCAAASKPTARHADASDRQRTTPGPKRSGVVSRKGATAHFATSSTSKPRRDAWPKRSSSSPCFWQRRCGP